MSTDDDSPSPHQGIEDIRAELRELQDKLAGDSISGLKDEFELKRADDRRRINELEEENGELRDRLNAVESRLDVLDEDAPSKEAKIREIVDFASNLRSEDQQAVKVTPKEIKGSAGISRRYAYGLIDEDEGLPAEYHWLLSAKQAREQQYGNAELDWDESTKGLVVDFEALHTDPEAVNKFTTRDSSEEGVE